MTRYLKFARISVEKYKMILKKFIASSVKEKPYEMTPSESVLLRELLSATEILKDLYDLGVQDGPRTIRIEDRNIEMLELDIRSGGSGAAVRIGLEDNISMNQEMAERVMQSTRRMNAFARLLQRKLRRGLLSAFRIPDFITRPDIRHLSAGWIDVTARSLRVLIAVRWELFRSETKGARKTADSYVV